MSGSTDGIPPSPRGDTLESPTMTRRFVYTRQRAFQDAMRKFQGTHHIHPEKINQVINALHLKMRDDGTNPDTVSIDDVYDYLRELKRESQYHLHNQFMISFDDVYLIHSIVTGHPGHDLTPYVNELSRLFDLQEKALDGVVANNTIHTHYKLYKLLQKVGYECSLDDFYTLRLNFAVLTYDDILQQAWRVLGWEWIDT